MNNILPAIPMFPEHKHRHHHHPHHPIHLHPPHNLPFNYRAYAQAPISLPPQTQGSLTYSRVLPPQTQGPLTYSRPPLQTSQIYMHQPQPLTHSTAQTGLTYSSPPTLLPQSRALPVTASYFPNNFTNSQVPMSRSIAPQSLSSSQIVQKDPPPCETILEYVPYEIPYEEEFEVERVERVPIERRKTDYYAIENQIEYVPITTYETIREMVPQTRTEYIPQTRVNYIPQITQNVVTVQKVQAIVEYRPVESRTVRYPEYEGQFLQEAQKSEKIVLKNSQMGNSGVLPPQSRGINQSQKAVFYGSPGVKSNASLQERFFLKKLDKDIRKLEKETKLLRSQSHSPGKKQIRKAEREAKKLLEDAMNRNQKEQEEEILKEKVEALEEEENLG